MPRYNFKVRKDTNGAISIVFKCVTHEEVKDSYYITSERTTFYSFLCLMQNSSSTFETSYSFYSGFHIALVIMSVLDWLSR